MDFRTDQAIYLQIADYICEMILTEQWAAGTKIPSIRELAVDIEVNPNTVMRTYTHLQDREIIFNRRGIGYFVAAEGLSKTKQMKQAEFISSDLPRLFRTLDVLAISIDDIKKMYDKYQSNAK